MASETRLRLDEYGRVLIPATFRKALAMRAGDELVLRLENDELRITTQKRRLERARRLLRKHAQIGRSLVDELIAERRETARKE